ncbi:hypothetical protein M011DRAFT_464518 [Sporormia fimetaria CBS 119925]|uniref:SWIRM domain-containing protein n=1 Tax=Sporormia fimetaria CBS 119925 TaxID=1340428 RepID=A0A6A6VKN8_9PLEO|nr:hypothetical protein M011DRAFT_464518 [Sporormia fimetaria CBS 119925]
MESVHDQSVLFESNGFDGLSMSMSDESAYIKPAGIDMGSVSSFNKLMLKPYSDSTPSSTPYLDTRGTSEANDSHIGGRDERDGSMSSGYVNGAEGSHAPSPLHFSQTLLPSSRDISPRVNHVGLDMSSKSGYADTDPTFEQHPTDKSLNGSSAKWEAKSGSPNFGQSSKRPGPKPMRRSRRSVPVSPGFRASSSIPDHMSWEEFARQSVLAAESSRLNPFALHPEEYKLLREHITLPQVTIYLNIRNAILRLWTKNPLLRVTAAEAAGCARDKRHFNLAMLAYNWLLRNGYINFGCVGLTDRPGTTTPRTKPSSSQRTILVVGAGMSGLGCARHLEGLSAQLEDQWSQAGEAPPKVIVLEARSRVGGRVYSHPLRNQTHSTLPAGHRCTAEMGAQIVTGFERGNPMNAIIRGQLGIPYHGLRDNTILYDKDGSAVDRSQDVLVEKLYNDVLERVSVYRHKPSSFRTVEGQRNMILFGRDPSDQDGPTIATLEKSGTPASEDAGKPSINGEKPSSGVEKLAGRAYQLTAGFDPNISLAEATQRMGWSLKPDAAPGHKLELDSAVNAHKYPTLGPTMDEGIRQYQELIDLQPRDLRLLNWHHANLEYANAVNVNQLSLSGWDQDIGNEFEGEHTEVIGGYQQVPRGLWQCPEKLDVRFKTAVKTIRYDMERGQKKPVTVECHNGEVFEADEVVLTTPLGVLKSGSITFDPPLPSWKEQAIERMGFGLLNKVILVYEEAFWEPHRDMFGLLNESEPPNSQDLKDYSARRGRFYLFWNCIKTSGRPTLVALMAGDSAHYAEATSEDQLVKEVTASLAKMFADKNVPLPSETIVTRWSRDPYARGSYSFVGPKTQAGDYDVMARPHGPIHFAGEATCGTHPATVHGAYLSGLRAAAEVVESMLGPIEVPSPLVEKKLKTNNLSPVPTPQHTEHKLQPESNQAANGRPSQPQHPLPNHGPQRDESYEASIIGAILSEIGERPIKPGRSGSNPFLLYTADTWYSTKSACDAERRAATKNALAKASKTEIRTAIGYNWRTASEEVRKPYMEKAQKAKEDTAAAMAGFEARVAVWDREAERIRREFVERNPPVDGSGDAYVGGTAIERVAGAGSKRLRRM